MDAEETDKPYVKGMEAETFAAKIFARGIDAHRLEVIG